MENPGSAWAGVGVALILAALVISGLAARKSKVGGSDQKWLNYTAEKAYSDQQTVDTTDHTVIQITWLISRYAKQGELSCEISQDYYAPSRAEKIAFRLKALGYSVQWDPRAAEPKLLNSWD